MSKPAQPDIAALVRAHSHRLHRFFTSSGVPYAAAQDLVQATFEVLLQKAGGAIDDVDRYLWGIARMKLRQSRTRLRTYEEFHQSQFAASTTTVSMKVDRRLRVSVLLARLDEEEDREGAERRAEECLSHTHRSSSSQERRIARRLSANRGRASSTP